MEIIASKKFRKQFRRLQPGEQKKFLTRRNLFLVNPFDPVLRNHALKGKYEGYRSIDITDDLRAVYEPLDENTAYFLYLDTHSNLYS